jgi:excinuclease ABC subunit B
VVKKLIEIQYERNRHQLHAQQVPGAGRRSGDFSGNYTDLAVRVEFFGDEIERISEINALTGSVREVLGHAAIYPASHYVSTPEKLSGALAEIERELEQRVAYFRERGKLLEAQRIEQRTRTIWK